MKTLIKEFSNMNKLPMFEIELEQEGEYEIYNISATKEGLSTQGSQHLILVEWDDCFSLDEHLQSLYELCLDDIALIESQGV